jgi:hypothetical protein
MKENDPTGHAIKDLGERKWSESKDPEAARTGKEKGR